MKTSILFITATLALSGAAFAQQADKASPTMATAKQQAAQIGSSFRKDMKAIARADKFRAEKGLAASGQHQKAMGAGKAQAATSATPNSSDAARRARMDAAYANWRSHGRS